MQTQFRYVSFIQGACCGIMNSLMINIWIVLSFYLTIPQAIIYIIGLPLAVISFILLTQSNLGKFILAWITSILFYIIVEIILEKLNLVNIFYHFTMDAEINMTAGDGFSILVIHMLNFIGIAIGVLFAFINTCIILYRKKSTRS